MVSDLSHNQNWFKTLLSTSGFQVRYLETAHPIPTTTVTSEVSRLTVAQTTLYYKAQPHSLLHTSAISQITSRYSFCLSVHYLTTIYKTNSNCSRIGTFPFRAKQFPIANVPTCVHGFFAVLDIASHGCYCRKELFKAKVN